MEILNTVVRLGYFALDFKSALYVPTFDSGGRGRRQPGKFGRRSLASRSARPRRPPLHLSVLSAESVRVWIGVATCVSRSYLHHSSVRGTSKETRKTRWRVRNGLRVSLSLSRVF